MRPLQPPVRSVPCRRGYLSQLVGRFLDYWNAGRKDDAARIRDVLRMYPVEPRLVALRDAIAQSLEFGPDAPIATSVGIGCY